jgi:hypothetical protein
MKRLRLIENKLAHEDCKLQKSKERSKNFDEAIRNLAIFLKSTKISNMMIKKSLNLCINFNIRGLGGEKEKGMKSF